MSLKFTNQATGTLVIDRLDKMLGLNEKGEVTLGFGTAFETSVDLLADCIEFSTELPRRQRPAIVRRVTVDLKKSGHLSGKALLHGVEVKQKEYLQKRIARFVLLTSASFRLTEKLRPIHIKDCVLTFARYRPKNFPLPDGGSLTLRDTTPRDYSCVKIFVSARDPYKAAEIAIEQIDFIRAIWNLFFNLRSGSRITFGGLGHKPVNRIRLGPLHTLHFPNGRLALEGEWLYAPLVEAAAERIDQNYDAIRAFERMIRKNINRSCLCDLLTSFLVRYVRALDEPDLSTSFLSLWSVLEEITGTSKSSYDVTVRRASFVFKGPQYARTILEYLRDQRNRIVHRGFQVDDAERLTYDLKRFVEALLKFLLNHSRRFVDFQTFCSFLDLPPDADLLRERIKQHKLAWKLHLRQD